MTDRVDHCLGCDSRDLEFRSAIVAPFVAARLGRRPTLCRLAGCRSCGFVFFEDRFDEQETVRLYGGYRGDAYFTERHRCEPWYTRAHNDDLGGAAEIRARGEAYRILLREAAPGATIDTVLDYGGDRGQLMIGGPGREHSVFDISGVAPEPGVEGVSNPASLSDRRFDLVLLCEVLEHASYPVEILRNVAAHVRPGGLLYITVPSRDFALADIPVGRLYDSYLRAILASRWITLAADFWSTGYRVKFRHIPPLGFAKMHEHVNLFDEASLASLLGHAGLSVLSCRTYGAGDLQALCRQPTVS